MLQFFDTPQKNVIQNKELAYKKDYFLKKKKKIVAVLTWQTKLPSGLMKAFPQGINLRLTMEMSPLSKTLTKWLTMKSAQYGQRVS